VQTVIDFLHGDAFVDTDDALRALSMSSVYLEFSDEILETAKEEVWQNSKMTREDALRTALMDIALREFTPDMLGQRTGINRPPR
jgi:hypothetical protein